MIQKFLFPKNTYNTSASIALLILRVAFAAAFMTHGWVKLTHFDATVQNFAPMGGAVTAVLVTFAEFFCSIGVMTGFLYRLALIPMIIDMTVAFLLAHGARLTGENNGEMAFLYLIGFIALMIMGTGKYAVDQFLVKKGQ